MNILPTLITTLLLFGIQFSNGHPIENYTQEEIAVLVIIKLIFSKRGIDTGELCMCTTLKPKIFF